MAAPRLNRAGGILEGPSMEAKIEIMSESLSWAEFSRLRKEGGLTKSDVIRAMNRLGWEWYWVRLNRFRHAGTVVLSSQEMADLLHVLNCP